MERSSEEFGRSVDKAITATTPVTMREQLGDREMECSTHGAYQSAGARYMGRREIWTPCPACEEKRLANERQAEAQKKADAARRELEYQIGEAAIPPRFIGRTLDNFNAITPEQQSALRIARDFVQDFEANAKRGNSLIFRVFQAPVRATLRPPCCKPSCRSIAVSTQPAWA